MEAKKSKLPNEPEVDANLHEKVDLKTGLRSDKGWNEKTSDSTSDNTDEPEVPHRRSEPGEPFY